MPKKLMGQFPIFGGNGRGPRGRSFGQINLKPLLIDFKSQKVLMTKIWRKSGEKSLDTHTQTHTDTHENDTLIRLTIQI